MPPVVSKDAAGVAKIAVPFTSVRKRDGRIVPFDATRIESAVYRAMKAAGEGDKTRDPKRIADQVVTTLVQKYQKDHVPTIEEIQDIVEETLILLDFPKTAKAYILYRYERARLRERERLISDKVRSLVAESKKYFRNPLSEFVHYRTYARWIDAEGRRETWIETVERYIDFMRENLGEKLTDAEYAELREAILWQEVMPSMRLLWSAGKAARTNNICAYNCSFIAPTKLEDFAEILYLSMSGCGVGFSVESQAIQQLPIVQRQTGKKPVKFVIEDSKEGWCDALTFGIKTWYAGGDAAFDFSKLRPAGARLHTMGGRSSGPDPLRQLLEFTKSKILARQGKRLKNIDAHDIICKIGEVVVVGGVRRTALISLSDIDDEEMRHAKTGQFYVVEPQRSMANNSAVYTGKPANTVFMDEWLALAKSGTGERGIFNRGGLKAQMPERRWKANVKYRETTGTNPCGEILLRNKEFCNLSEIVARAEDTQDSLLKKARLATIFGTYQSTLTNFPYLSPGWKKNCDEERLLGVSITGQWDSPAARNPETLQKMRQVCLETNKEFAKRFGITPSMSVTCVKPSGNVSQLVDAASGMHPRHSRFYIRRVRISATDPLFHMLRDQKFPFYPEVGQMMDSATTFVLEFPVKAPGGSMFKDDQTALDQLEYWKMVKENFTEHNPSVTVSVSDDEWLETAHWLYQHWDMIGGLSFLPRTKHVYRLAPYEEITEERYNELVAHLPKIDFSHIMMYEREDQTQGAKELACVGGVCEVDFSAEGVSAVTA